VDRDAGENMTSTLPVTLHSSRPALLLVDVQERLAAAMEPGAMSVCERNILVLIDLARRLHFPVVTSEQYPKGLGPTVPALRQALEASDLSVERFEKMQFSCGPVPAFQDIIRRLDRDPWIVVGMETHVCIYQTARDLVAMGRAVHVPADAILSRTPANKDIGLRLIERTGAFITSTETVVFDALGTSGTDDFRAMSKQLK
jgi:nicotinamidase-related amidase